MLNKFVLGIKLESGQTSLIAFKLITLTLPLFSVFEELEQLCFNNLYTKHVLACHHFKQSYILTAGWYSE